MLTNNKTKPIIGDCDAYCNRTNVEVWVTDRNILMCKECREKDADLARKNGEMKSIIDEAKRIDSSIEVKQDIFNLPEIAAVELQAAINADDSIPADMKSYTYTKMCHQRRLDMQKAIFDVRQDLQRKENEMRFWQVQMQTSAATLHAKYQDEFKTVEYRPTPPKSIKPPKTKAPSGPSPRALAQEAREVAKKHNLDATVLQMIAKAHHLSMEGAAQFMLKQLS